MSPAFFLTYAVEPAFLLLPTTMNSDRARAMMIAIALQESGLVHRHQVGGPAHGYLQFELGGGVRGMVNHPLTRPHLKAAMEALDYSSNPTAEQCYAAIEHNDIVACIFARLLLLTLPEELPRRDQPAKAYDQYIECWRPGKPHPETWPKYYQTAWELLHG